MMRPYSVERADAQAAARADVAALPAHSYAAVGIRVRKGESNEAVLLTMPRLYDDNGNRLEA